MSAEEEVTGRKKKVMYKTIEWGVKSRKKKNKKNSNIAMSSYFTTLTLSFSHQKRSTRRGEKENKSTRHLPTLVDKHTHDALSLSGLAVKRRLLGIQLRREKAAYVLTVQNSEC